MPAPAIKICGLTTPDTLEAAIGARADYAGFNFYPPSPRFLANAAAPRLRAIAAGRIRSVGVFVDAAPSTIRTAIEVAGLDILQLHGHESPEQTARLRQEFGLPVWRVVSVTGADDLLRCGDYVGAADLLLLDAKTPAGSLPGGMGLRFDWALLSGWRAPLPWGLAGGLTAVNVAGAAAATGAALVDTASGVESAPGVKDPALIAAFCAAARGE